MKTANNGGKQIMLSNKDQQRLRDLCELDRQGKLGEFVERVAHELRREGLGRVRDPREFPFLKSALRVYEQLYQPPWVPESAEVLHVLFPGLRAEIADRLLREWVSKLRETSLPRN
jgi:hypothetical protein